MDMDGIASFGGFENATKTSRPLGSTINVSFNKPNQQRFFWDNYPLVCMASLLNGMFIDNSLW
jgi:hypothetical protein